MSTAAFFMKNFGRHFIKPSGDDWADVGQVLRRAYPMTGRASVSRLLGWAIVRPGSATLKRDFVIPVVQTLDVPYIEAFAAELATWDGQEPRIFMLFDKAPIAAQDIFVSVDKRRVRICTNAGARTEDWTTRPPAVKGAAK